MKTLEQNRGTLRVSNRTDRTALRSASSHQMLVQPKKLELTTPGDGYEREADRMADFVMRKAYSGLPAEMPSATPVLPPVISRRASSSTSGVAVGNATERGILASRGIGQPMPTALRSRMESSFGADFSGVRLHTGSTAETMSSDLNAKAFTYGNDIYFNRGQYSPDTTAGQHLIAHELTHVVQQSGKVGRDPDHAEEKRIADSYFYGTWNWAVFCDYMNQNHSEIAKEKDIQREYKGWIFGYNDPNWSKEKGEDFLREVSEAIVRKYYYDQLRRSNWDLAYANAINDFQKNRVVYTEISPVFNALERITETNREGTKVLEENKATHSMNGTRKKIDINFDGAFFDNRKEIQIDSYNFFKDFYPKALDNISNISDIENHGEEYYEQLNKQISNLTRDKFHAFRRDNNNLPNTKPSQSLFYLHLIKEVNEYEIRHNNKTAGVVRRILESRYKNLYEVNFSVPKHLISAEIWTNVFITTMTIEVAVISAPLAATFAAAFGGSTVSIAISTAVVNGVASGLSTAASEINEYAHADPDKRKSQSQIVIKSLCSAITSAVTTGLSKKFPLKNEGISDIVYSIVGDSLNGIINNIDKYIQNDEVDAVELGKAIISTLTHAILTAIVGKSGASTPNSDITGVLNVTSDVVIDLSVNAINTN